MRKPDISEWKSSSNRMMLWKFEGILGLLFPPIIFFSSNLYYYLTVFVCIVFCMLLNRFGYTLPVFLRMIRLKIAGNRSLGRSRRSRPKRFF